MIYFGCPAMLDNRPETRSEASSTGQGISYAFPTSPLCEPNPRLVMASASASGVAVFMALSPTPMCWSFTSAQWTYWSSSTGTTTLGTPLLGFGLEAPHEKGLRHGSTNAEHRKWVRLFRGYPSLAGFKGLLKAKPMPFWGVHSKSPRPHCRVFPHTLPGAAGLQGCGVECAGASMVHQDTAPGEEFGVRRIVHEQHLLLALARTPSRTRRGKGDSHGENMQKWHQFQGCLAGGSEASDGSPQRQCCDIVK